MSDGNNSDGFAAAGSGKSPEEVAFDLLNKLKGQGVWGERNMADILNMYAECLDATKGLRAYPGQKRVNMPTHEPQVTSRSQQTAPAQASAPVRQPAAAQQPAQAQTQSPAFAASPHSPQAQQQTLQQAFKPGP